ncbi:MAG: transposase [Planctomycetes bacterium]|nr:transposase [Planctomycetota bacterium]
MTTSPLAYFITFSTYGAWLHGRDIGSIDKEHNEFGTPFLKSDNKREDFEHSNMREPPYVLNADRRKIVLATIREVCKHRRWKLWACHVRTTHVHAIVSADAKPEKVMSDLKAYASRRLKEQLNEQADAKRWTQHGSTRYLWMEDDAHAKIEYTLNGQGDPMESYDGRSEPEA